MRLDNSPYFLAPFMFLVGCSSQSNPTQPNVSETSVQDVFQDTAKDAFPETTDSITDSPFDHQTDIRLSCNFNRECPTETRCECSESDGCFCNIGKRGTGKSGIDTCKDGNDCESSLCAEGPGGVYYCSGECGDAGACTGMMPLCVNVAMLGSICARKPPSDAGPG